MYICIDHFISIGFIRNLKYFSTLTLHRLSST